MKKIWNAWWALCACNAAAGCHPLQLASPPCLPCTQACARRVADVRVQRWRHYAPVSQWQVQERVDSVGYRFEYGYPPEKGIDGGGLGVWVDGHTCTIVKIERYQ